MMDAENKMHTEVNLNLKIDIAKLLSKIVSASFGPFCQKSMITTSTGSVVVTSQGIAILKSLQIGHPLAQVVVESACKHYLVVGDGTKTFILLLEHSLQAVQDIINKHIGSHLGDRFIQKQTENSLSNRIALAFGEFSNTVLLDVFREVEQKADILDSSCSHDYLKNKIFGILKTTFLPHFSSSLSNFFTNLLMDALISEKDSLNLESLKLSVEFVLDNFEFMHVKSSGQNYKESSAVCGILIPRNFAFCADNISDRKIKCVLLKCPVEGVLSDDNDTVRLKSEHSIQTAVYQNVRNAERFLQMLRTQGVTLILSSEHVPEYVLSLCRSFDISVICYLDDEDIQFVEKVSGKFSVHNTWDSVDDSFIIDVSQVKKISAGRQIHVLLETEKVLTKPLILCAPTDTMCHQLGNIIYKGLKSLLMCFQKTDNRLETVTTNSSLCRVEKLTKSANESFTPSVNISTEKCSWDETAFMKQEISLDNNSPIQTDESKTRNSQSDLTFVTFPGGGYFEYFVSEILDQKKKTCLNNPKMSWCCQILSKSLKSVPFLLHKNLSYNSRFRSFLDKETQIYKALKANNTAGYNSRGHVCDTAKENVLEPPFAKFTTIQNVTQLLQQILKLDGIVSVKMEPKIS